ncbi:type II secretion system protein GspL [Indioceanicola profundi]|uniref:type II secretion system protein GspL n=1 Tax=Indioceanicola profundi TaxID=2220096 RepID=UPI0021F1D356|nr:type II secretion system protein GspL [Indioceanicola profundi]
MPEPQEGAALLLDRGGYVLVCTPAARFAAERELLPLLLPGVLAGVEHVTLYGDEMPLPAGLAVDRLPALDGPAFCRLALGRMQGRNRPLDLFQGRFRQRRVDGSSLLLWRRAAAMAAVAAGLHLGITAISAWRLESEAAALEQQAETVFRQAFPDTSRIVNLRAQARARLVEQQSGGDAYLRLSQLLFSGLQDLPGVAVKSLRFEPGRAGLAVEVSYLSYVEMERLRAAIGQAGGELTEGGARQEGDRTLATITLTLAEGARI